MYPTGNSLAGIGALPVRRFKIGSTVTKGQVICKDETSGQLAEILDPASVNDYSEMLGIANEGGTYSTSQGTGASSAEVLVECSYSPFMIIKGLCSGATTASTALGSGLDENILTNTSASSGGTVVTDSDVGTSDFIGGYMYALTGQNAGASRIVTSHSDNTSETVTVPFDYALAVGDTFVRTFAFGNQGLELTTNFEQFNMKPGAGVNLPDTGMAIVWNVEVDTSNQGTSAAPVVHTYWVPSDHVFNSLA